MKIAYVGIDLLYPALKALWDNRCEIIKIFTCKTNNVTEFNEQIVEFAKNNNISYTLERITVNDILWLKEMGCELLICGGYYYKIPVDESLPMINIHPTLLPVGRGSWPMPLIILRGDKKSGVTLHKISEGFDEGDIILQKEFNISDNESHESYMKKSGDLAYVMINELLANFELLYSNAKPQGEGEYLQEPKREVFTINENSSFKNTDLILRAFYGYECYYEKADKIYEIIKGEVVKEKMFTQSMEGVYLPIKGGYVWCPIVKEVMMRIYD